MFFLPGLVFSVPKDVRSTDNTSTNMLHYIVRMVLKSNHESKSLAEEMPHVTSKEIKTSLQDVAGHLSAIESSLMDAKYDLEAPSETVKVELNLVGSGSDKRANISKISPEGNGEGDLAAKEREGPAVRVEIVADSYYDVMTSFVEESTVVKNDLLERVEKCKKTFSGMVAFFGENPAALQSESEFWDVIAEVAEAYKGIHQAEVKLLKEEREKEIWRQKRAKSKSMAATNGSGVSYKPAKYKRTGYNCPIHDEPVRYERWERSGSESNASGGGGEDCGGGAVAGGEVGSVRPLEGGEGREVAGREEEQQH